MPGKILSSPDILEFRPYFAFPLLDVVCCVDANNGNCALLHVLHQGDH
jgi:hypothetical protein